MQADGKVLLGGRFTSLQPNGAASEMRPYLARVNPDGTLDTSFAPNPSSYVESLAAQADGKVIVGGDFYSFQPNGATVALTANYLARLNPDGTLDAGFYPNPNAYVYSVALQADGEVLLGGGFTTVSPNGSGYVFSRQGLARLLNEPATQHLSAPSPSQVVWTRGGGAPEVSQVTFELSTDGGTHWTALGNGLRVGTSANWQLTGLALPASGQLRARGRTPGGHYNGSCGLIEAVTSFAGFSRPPVINAQSLTKLADGAFQFTCYNPNNLALSVLAATNAAAPLSNWTVLGSPLNLGGGIYSFSDPAATNFSARCYLLRIP